MSTTIDTANKFLVAARPGPDGNKRILALNSKAVAEITIGGVPVDDALMLAAWIVAVSGDPDRFEAILRELMNT